MTRFLVISEWTVHLTCFCLTDCIVRPNSWAGSRNTDGTTSTRANANHFRTTMNNQDRAEARIKMLGVSGSLRKRSLNTALLLAGARQLPPEVDFTLADIHDLPLYDEDIRERGVSPQSVNRFREQVRDADAVWIATPEYNFSYPGVLKNAIDWASRPPDQPFLGKPVAIMGASSGMLGTARAQYHLRQVFVFLNAHVLNTPEVFVGAAPTKFDEDLNLIDEGTRKVLSLHINAFLAWANRVRNGLPLAAIP